MPLKLSLKPGEKFVLNGAVLANGDKRTSLVLQNKACVLREKDIMQPEDADTPARRIYLPIMMMYLDGEDTERYYNDFALRMTEFMGAIRNREVLGDLRRNQPRCHARGLLPGLDDVQETFRIRTGAVEL